MTLKRERLPCLRTDMVREEVLFIQMEANDAGLLAVLLCMLDGAKRLLDTAGGGELAAVPGMHTCINAVCGQLSALNRKDARQHLGLLVETLRM